MAQRCAGDLHQPRKRLTQLQDQVNRSGGGQRKDDQQADKGCAGLGKQTEACKDHGEKISATMKGMGSELSVSANISRRVCAMSVLTCIARACRER